MEEDAPESLENSKHEDHRSGKEFSGDEQSKRNDFVTRMDDTEESEPRKEGIKAPGNKNSAQRMRIKISQNFEKIGEDMSGLN
jgi:hypothetical protein